MKNLLFILIPVALFIVLLSTIKVEDNNKKTSGESSSNAISPAKEETVTPSANEPVVKTGDLTTEKKLVTISTSKGDIELELYPQAAPKTVENFLKKATDGFYNNLTWHRVEDWVIQGGDPDGNGTGGGDQSTELNDLTFSLGSVGIARGGDIKINNDSQFFIVKKDSDFLDTQYTNFGKVVSGMEIVDQIAIGDKILSIKTK